MSKETFVLSNAMMNETNALKQNPPKLNMDTLPFGLREDYRDNPDLYAIETQIPKSKLEGLMKKRRGQSD